MTTKEKIKSLGLTERQVKGVIEIAIASYVAGGAHLAHVLRIIGISDVFIKTCKKVCMSLVMTETLQVKDVQEMDTVSDTLFKTHFAKDFESELP